MKTLPLLSLTLLMSIVVTQMSCGGESDSYNSESHQRAIEAANAKEMEARSLAVESPCTSAGQCGNLAFLAPAGTCRNWSYKPYSLVSPTAAAASAAAQEQQQLANHAASLARPSDIACPAVVNQPPVLQCVSSVCGAVAQ